MGLRDRAVPRGSRPRLRPCHHRPTSPCRDQKARVRGLMSCVLLSCTRPAGRRCFSSKRCQAGFLARARCSSAWRQSGTQHLFPGGRPGRPVSPETLSARLNALGIHVRLARNGAILGMVGQVHWKVLADLLGMSDSTAQRWHYASGGDRASYGGRLSNGTNLVVFVILRGQLAEANNSSTGSYRAWPWERRGRRRGRRLDR